MEKFKPIGRSIRKMIRILSKSFIQISFLFHPSTFSFSFSFQIDSIRRKLHEIQTIAARTKLNEVFSLSSLSPSKRFDTNQFEHLFSIFSFLFSFPKTNIDRPRSSTTTNSKASIQRSSLPSIPSLSSSRTVLGHSSAISTVGPSLSRSTTNEKSSNEESIIDDKFDQCSTQFALIFLSLTINFICFSVRHVG